MIEKQPEQLEQSEPLDQIVPAASASENHAGSPPGHSSTSPGHSSTPRPDRGLAKRRSWKRRLSVLFGLITLVYVGVCATFVMLEPRLVFPGAYMEASNWLDLSVFDPDDPIIGEVVNLSYNAVDGFNLQGRFYVRPDADRVILFLHGNGIRAIDLDGWTRRLSDVMNATVLTAEFRGFQNDGFTPSDASTFEDAESAIHALAKTTGVPIEQITVYGRSLGGGVAAGLVERLARSGRTIRSLVLERTFNSVADVGSAMFPWLPVNLLVRNRFDSVSHLANFDGVVVQIHGRPDRIVPMVNGKRLYDSLATDSKMWIEVPDLRHNDRMSKEHLEGLFQTLCDLEKRESD